MLASACERIEQQVPFKEVFMPCVCVVSRAHERWYTMCQESAPRPSHQLHRDDLETGCMSYLARRRVFPPMTRAHVKPWMLLWDVVSHSRPEAFVYVHYWHRNVLRDPWFEDVFL